LKHLKLKQTYFYIYYLIYTKF